MKERDSYAPQLVKGHETRFNRYVSSLPITIRQRIEIRKLYNDVIDIHNVYCYYDVNIRDFTYALIQGKLETVALDIDHTDPFGNNQKTA